MTIFPSSSPYLEPICLGEDDDFATFARAVYYRQDSFISENNSREENRCAIAEEYDASYKLAAKHCTKARAELEEASNVSDAELQGILNQATLSRQEVNETFDLYEERLRAMMSKVDGWDVDDDFDYLKSVMRARLSWKPTRPRRSYPECMTVSELRKYLLREAEARLSTIEQDMKELLLHKEAELAMFDKFEEALAKGLYE